MAEEEEKKEKLSSDTDSEGMEDITWEDASADLEKQREMLKDAAGVDNGMPDVTQQAPPDEQIESAVAGPDPANMPDNISRILDIPLPVTVELGKTRMLINDLLQLGQGSVIELTKLVGEPLEVLINERLIAKGEVVVINEKFGIRLTEIMTPVERIESLK